MDLRQLGRMTKLQYHCPVSKLTLLLDYIPSTISDWLIYDLVNHCLKADGEMSR